MGDLGATECYLGKKEEGELAVLYNIFFLREPKKGTISVLFLIPGVKGGGGWTLAW